MLNTDSPSRNIGLDFVRSMAIVLVLIAHDSLFFHGAGRDVSAILHGSGFFGVELFFVLSGFLIGDILIRNVVFHNTLEVLLDFWKRRWLRTLPAYYLVWCVLYIISSHNPADFKSLVMLQSFYPSAISIFGVSWSLASEEWFYLLTPILLCFLAKIRVFSREKLITIFCIAGIILFPLLRALAATWLDESWGMIRKYSFIRFDAFLYGILISLMQHYYSNIYRWIARYKYVFILFSGVGLIFCALQFFNVENLETFFNKTLLFSLADLCFMPILVICESAVVFKKWDHTWKKNLVYFISITRYSVYLIHWDIMEYFRGFKFSNGKIIHAVILLLICLAVTYFLSYILYRFWEKPFMNLRNRKILIPKLTKSTVNVTD